MNKGLFHSLLIAVFFTIFSACGHEPSKVSRMLLGTVVTVTIADENGNINGLFDAAFGEIEKVHKYFSLYDPESEISKINSNAYPKPYYAGDEVYSLIKRSLEISEKTAGAFDITWASAGKLWDFSGEEFIPPDDKIIKDLLPLISYKNVILDDKKKSIKVIVGGTKIGLGGVAKGYAVQKAISTLRNRGVGGAIVACAGDIQVIGDNYGRPWKAGIQDPRGKSVMATFIMKDNESVSTSGDYERFRIVNGKRYHHIINPATGYPADSGLISVTVLSHDPVKSDAYATAFFVSGLEKTCLILPSIDDLSVVLVTSDMKVYVSKSLKERISFREEIRPEYF